MADALMERELVEVLPLPSLFPLTFSLIYLKSNFFPSSFPGWFRFSRFFLDLFLVSLGWTKHKLEQHHGDIWMDETWRSDRCPLATSTQQSFSPVLQQRLFTYAVLWSVFNESQWDGTTKQGDCTLPACCFGGCFSVLGVTRLFQACYNRAVLLSDPVVAPFLFLLRLKI